MLGGYDGGQQLADVERWVIAVTGPRIAKSIIFWKLPVGIVLRIPGRAWPAGLLLF